MSTDSLNVNFLPAEENESIFNVFNFPNPFTTRTFFTFQIKDSPFTEVKTKLSIYSQRGILVNTINDISIYDNLISIEWDGLDKNSNLVPNGSYLYTLDINFDGESYKKSNLLSIIR